MIVLDASALLEVLLRTPVAVEIEERIFGADSLHAPHLLDLEVAQVLRRYAAAGEMESERCQDALVDLAGFPITRYPHDLFLPRIWQLRHAVTAYDGAYLVLAETLGAPLITRDRRLAAATGHMAAVELF